MFIAHTKNNTFISSEYLSNYVSAVWEVYSPIERLANTVEYDHTTYSRFGKYIIFSGPKGSRGIFITERYDFSPKQRSYCLKMAVYSQSSLNVLEVYQGESSHPDKGLKIWNLNQTTHNYWKVFEIEAFAYSDKSRDLYFYIVSFSINRNRKIAIISRLFSPKQ